jgi:CDP-4-dehydro-6-deoxyglucose reductase
MAAQEFKCVVKSFKMLTPTVFETVFEGRLASDPSVSMTFQAGQFVSIVIPGAGPNGRDLRRAYSIASGPETHPIELCVKLVEGGPGTNYLYKLREGDTFKGFAPYGDFLYRTHSAKNACFIATGTGIAPFRSMVFSEKFKSDPPQKA